MEVYDSALTAKIQQRFPFSAKCRFSIPRQARGLQAFATRCERHLWCWLDNRCSRPVSVVWSLGASSAVVFDAVTATFSSPVRYFATVQDSNRCWVDSSVSRLFAITSAVLIQPLCSQRIAA